MWKTTPAEKTSLLGATFSPILQRMISGEQQPGVPHLQAPQSSSQAQTESPKSPITTSRASLSRSIMFSNLMSRCTTSLRSSSASPSISPRINLLISSRESLERLPYRNSNKLPPCITSVTTQQLLSVSQTPYRVSRCSWSTPRRISIQFLKLQNFWGWARNALLQKTLAANRFPSSRRRTSNTEADPPVPSLRMGLKQVWNPDWLSLRPSTRNQMRVSSLNWMKKESVTPSQWMSLNPLREGTGSSVDWFASVSVKIFQNLMARPNLMAAMGPSSSCQTEQRRRQSSLRRSFKDILGLTSILT